MKSMAGVKGLLVCWGMLLALSVGTVLSGAAGLWWAVLALAVAKACLIADGFMELRHGPRIWRVAMLGWAMAVVGLIGVVG